MIRYSQTADIHPCRLNLNDLKKLYAAIVTDFPETNRPGDRVIRTNMSGVDVREHSLEEFLAHQNLPPILTRLSVEMLGWDDSRDIDRTLDLTFYDNFISIRISGKSESWVLGKLAQMTRTLRTFRTRLWFLQTAAGFAASGAISGLAIVGLWFVIYRLTTRGFDIVVLAASVSILAACAFVYSTSRLRHVEIDISGRDNSRARMQLAFTVIVGLATIIGAAAAVLGLFMK